MGHMYDRKLLIFHISVHEGSLMSTDESWLGKIWYRFVLEHINISVRKDMGSPGGFLSI